MWREKHRDDFFMYTCMYKPSQFSCLLLVLVQDDSVTHHEATFIYLTSLTLSVIEYITVKFPALHKVTAEWELFKEPVRCF